MRYLLDTNVISGLRVRGRNPAVEAWAASIELENLYVSAPTIAEIERGVHSKESQDPGQGRHLRTWLEGHVIPAFVDRVLPLDLKAARILGSHKLPAHAPLDDALVGAIAQANGMIVVSRNTRHFEPLGISCLNPWESR